MKKIPNILSGFRLISFPILIYLIHLGEEQIFSIWFCLNLFTDVLDGWIARKFDASTPLGAKLDSLADIGSYILAVIAIFQFHWLSFQTYKFWIFAFIILYSGAIVLSFIKFKTFPSLHLFSHKIAGCFLGVFLFILFSFQFVSWLFIISITIGFLATIEELCCLIKMKVTKSNVYSYFKL